MCQKQKSPPAMQAGGLSATWIVSEVQAREAAEPAQ